ncbi:MAG TPA: hypothetical protein VH278_08175 [Burkholderiaceae bacterium]|nr:hypothetical protein [Burkholderiaceae bacterium]
MAITASLIAVLFAALPAMAVESVGVVTILEGDATAIRGLSKFALAEGVRLSGNDLVETGRSAFLRIEFTDGVIADLGPGTRVQVNQPTLRRNDRPAFYLLSGWLKLSAAKLGAGTKASIASPQFDAVGLDGDSVEQVQGGTSAVFAENGPLRVLDHSRSAPAPIQVKSGDFLVLSGDETPKISQRPAHDFIASLPRPFEDPLPSRLARYSARDVPAKPLGAFTYAEVEGWLDAEPMIRRRFVREWAVKADDDAFRQHLEARLSKHPEWERLLYPERFEPKPSAPVASAPAVPVNGGSSVVNPSVPVTTTPEAGAPEGAPTR